MTAHNALDNPYAPPRAPASEPAMDDGSAEATRRKLAPIEAFAKAVGILGLVYAVYDAFVIVYYGVWAINARTGLVSTAWPSFRPAGILAIASAPFVTVSGLIAWYCLRQLRSQTTWILGIFAGALLLQFVLAALNDYQRDEPTAGVMTLALGAALLVPVAVLWATDLSLILSNEYRQVVAETRPIRVKAKLPFVVKCGMFVLLLFAIGLFISV
jgi:hypothetical protein